MCVLLGYCVGFRHRLDCCFGLWALNGVLDWVAVWALGRVGRVRNECFIYIAKNIGIYFNSI